MDEQPIVNRLCEVYNQCCAIVSRVDKPMLVRYFVYFIVFQGN